MRNILSGARGMSPVVLVILIAWALLSVIFLTGTLVAARSIDRSVSGVTNRTTADGKPENNIYDTVQEIGKEGKFIAEAKKTVVIAKAIRKAAAPLSGHLARTLTIADKGIKPRLVSINGKVEDIIDVAGKINTNVVGISGTVNSIHSSVLTIGESVQSIGSSVRTINRSAQQINGSARSILGSLSSILSLVQHIDGSVDTIVGQANTINGVADTILPDFNQILANVSGQPAGSAHGNTVVGHANGIDCSTLLLGSQQCNK
jgi:methyl-accepting chemotaxis protein